MAMAKELTWLNLARIQVSNRKSMAAAFGPAKANANSNVKHRSRHGRSQI
jgi:hypothetical protein